MPTLRITKRAVDQTVPNIRDVFLWDTDLKGFGLKVTPKGARSYVLQYRLGGRGSPTRRYTIGVHGSPWTPDSARQRAAELLQFVDRGIDPIENDRQRTQLERDLSFSRYVELFIERYAKREQPRSWQQSKQVLLQHALPVFRARALPAITRREIAGLLEEQAANRPATARYLHAVLRKMFRWAVARGDLLNSPMSEMPSPAPALSRDRVLRDAELAAIWRGTINLGFPFGPVYRLLIATGQRREEVAGMAWSELDQVTGIWTIPATRAKNGVAHRVPLNKVALAELQAIFPSRLHDLVFTTTGTSPPAGWSKAKKRLDQIVNDSPSAPELSPWRTHDLRRTFATALQRIGVRFEVTEALLNHLSGARSGVAGVYQRHDWDNEKRDAMTAWSEMLGDLVSGPCVAAKDTNIIPFEVVGSQR